MKQTPKFIVVAGARPNFMKIAPIMASFAKLSCSPGSVVVKLVHTGQHYDPKMSDDFFADLGIPDPDINLAVGSGTHAEQTARVMVAFEKVCLEEKPDWVVVVGDVNSTLACSIPARKLGIKMARLACVHETCPCPKKSTVFAPMRCPLCCSQPMSLLARTSEMKASPRTEWISSGIR